MDIYWDSINMRYPEKGSVSGGVFTPSDTTDEVGLLIDNSIELSTNFTGSTPKGVRFIADTFAGLSFSQITTRSFSELNERFSHIGIAGIGSADYVIIKCDDNPNVEVWASDESMVNYTKVFDSTIENNAWSINALDSSTSASYFVVQFTGNYNVNVFEMILAKRITDVYRYDTWTEKQNFNVALNTAHNGGEFSNKQGVSTVDKNFSWKVMNQTYMNDILTFRDSVYNQDKYFLTVEDDRKFGKLLNDPTPIEVGYQHYSVDLNVRQYA